MYKRQILFFVGPRDAEGCRLGCRSAIHRSAIPGYGRSMAVSYTHLRAHETVLDLVCRLLLEKTKLIRVHTCVRIDYLMPRAMIDINCDLVL